MSGMRNPILLIVVMVIAAGCTTSQPHHAGTFDTGDIPPGEERTLVYETAGSLGMHCHPHQWMLHNVTVTDEPAGEFHVDILDGVDESEFRFEPADLTIGKGSRVTYHNHGNFTHTATQKADDAAATGH